MPSASPGTVYQVGTQGTFDTAVAATAKLAVPRMNFTPTDQVNRPQLANGIMLMNPGNEYPVVRGSLWEVPAYECNYEQLPGWMGMLIDGGETAVGASTPYTWTFTRSIGAQGLNMATFERRMTDFTNHIDEEFPNCVATEATLSGQGSGAVQIAVQGFGAAEASSTLTASLSMPTPEHVPFALSEAYLDSSWANAGNTQLSGKVLSWSLGITTGVVGLPTADGRANLDYGVRVYNGRAIGHTLTMRLLQDKTLYDAEKAAAKAQTLRAIRLSFAGTASRAFNIDALVKHAAGSLYAVDESDGQVIYDVSMVAATDGTDSLEAVVVNTSDEEWGWAAA